MDSGGFEGPADALPGLDHAELLARRQGEPGVWGRGGRRLIQHPVLGGGVQPPSILLFLLLAVFGGVGGGERAVAVTPGQGSGQLAAHVGGELGMIMSWRGSRGESLLLLVAGEGVMGRCLSLPEEAVEEG